MEHITITNNQPIPTDPTPPGILRSIILAALAPHRLTLTPDPLPPLSRVSFARLGGASVEGGPPTPDGVGVGEVYAVDSGVLPLLSVRS